jgi:hypothetical protein
LWVGYERALQSAPPFIAHTRCVVQVVSECERYKAAHQRAVYHTPKSFLGFLAQYRTMYRQRLEALQQEEARVSSGLDKLQQVCACGLAPPLCAVVRVQCGHLVPPSPPPVGLCDFPPPPRPPRMSRT